MCWHGSQEPRQPPRANQERSKCRYHLHNQDPNCNRWQFNQIFQHHGREDPQIAPLGEHCSTTAMGECIVGMGHAIVGDSGGRSGLLGGCEGTWPITTGSRGTKKPGRLSLYIHSTRWCDALVAAETMIQSVSSCPSVCRSGSVDTEAQSARVIVSTCYQVQANCKFSTGDMSHENRRNPTKRK